MTSNAAASKAAQSLPHGAFADRLLQANKGVWPDMEGLIRDIYVAHLQPGDCALDVGVNHGGHFVQMASAVGPTGRVIGFEAVPELARRTRVMIAQHYADIGGRIALNEVAVSNKDGAATFYFSKANDSGLSGLAERTVLKSGEVEEIPVSVRKIDDYLDDDFIARLAFAKFDVEGAEYHAFQGATKVLARHPLLTFEWDSSAPRYFDYNPPALYDLICAAGYQIYDVFGFHYADAKAFLGARVWNFVAIPSTISAAHVLKPSIDTLRPQFPELF